MNVNLNNLRPIQAELDDIIIKKHDIKKEDTQSKRILAFLVELGELANETRTFKYWSLKGPSAKKVILEEYVDGIHFLVSLSNDLKLDLDFTIEQNNDELTTQFIDVFSLATILNNEFNNTNLINLFEKYLEIGRSLGFDEATIIEGYMEKNKENHKRQEEGY